MRKVEEYGDGAPLSFTQLHLIGFRAMRVLLADSDKSGGNQGHSVLVPCGTAVGLLQIYAARRPGKLPEEVMQHN